MPPENDIPSDKEIYVFIDEKCYRLGDVLLPQTAEDIVKAEKGYKSYRLEPIEVKCRVLWKQFQNNKKARLRKQQIIKFLPRGHGKYYLKWLEAAKTAGAVQMTFSWMAYWYRRLHNATN